MNLTPEQIRWIFIYVFVLIGSVAFHEFGHAIMADRLGDDTPRRQGRVTLNPIAHIDPLGTLILPFAGATYGAASGHLGGFGWGKPVQFQRRNITRKISMALGDILVSLAGPAMNIVLALLLAGIHTALVHANVVSWWVETPDGMERGEISQIFMFAVNTNFILCFFNLLPAPPLDGGHVLGNIVPYRHRDKFDAYARFGPFVVLAFALIPQLSQVFRIPARFCTDHLYSLIGLG
jgi:Zn-dependent protease